MTNEEYALGSEDQCGRLGGRYGTPRSNRELGSHAFLSVLVPSP